MDNIFKVFLNIIREELDKLIGFLQKLTDFL